MPEITRPQKITLGEMRAAGVRDILVYCADYRCAHAVRISADRWPDPVRLSDLRLPGVRPTRQSGRIGSDYQPKPAAALPLYSQYRVCSSVQPGTAKTLRTLGTVTGRPGRKWRSGGL